MIHFEYDGLLRVSPKKLIHIRIFLMSCVIYFELFLYLMFSGIKIILHLMKIRAFFLNRSYIFADVFDCRFPDGAGL